MPTHIPVNLQFTTYPSLSLYIHFPWCEKKCPYCDFNSHEKNTFFDEEKYLAALIADLDAELPDVWGRSVQSIFMGGGTPSLFSAQAMDKLLNSIRARLKLLPDCEVTMEANPGTLDQYDLSAYRAAGITRLSVGVQSMQDTQLQALGRIHSAVQARDTIVAAHNAGFDSFNVDLMYGLPNQTCAEALKDLQEIIDLKPPHISHYQLTIEPNTAFAVTPPELPDVDSSWEMQLQCQSLLGSNGYAQYEISAYAQPGQQCRHNLNYWHFGDYLGIGAGAHQKITLPAEQSIKRKMKHKHPATYIDYALSATEQQQHVKKHQQVAADDVVFEFMLNALRLTSGVSNALFTAHTGLPVAIIKPKIDKAKANGWLKQDVNSIIPTATGLQFLNDLNELFLPES